MDQLEQLTREVEAIKERNRRVEADKAWEQSTFRIASITVLTYVLAAAVMYAMGIERYLSSALVAAVGYFLSMRSLPAIKKWWISKHVK